MNYTQNTLVAALVVAGLVACYGWQVERAAHANTKAAHAEYLANAERTARELSERNRNTEQELAHAREKHDTEAAAIRKLVDRTRADARAAGQRLQDAAADAAERARAQCASAAAAELRDPASDPIGVFAVVLGMADSAAGRMAEIATERGAAGLACQREHSTTREAVNSVQ